MFFNPATLKKKDINAIRAFELTKPKGIAIPEDSFQLAYSNKEYEEMNDDELIEIKGTTLIYDVECYINYFMVSFKSKVNGKCIIFEQDDDLLIIDTAKLDWVIKNFCLVGFNEKDYDLPLTLLAARGHDCKFLKDVSNWLVSGNRGEQIRFYQADQKYNFGVNPANHVDLIEVLPLTGSLKLYSGRIHCQRMQDLPYVHTSSLTPSEIDLLRAYNINDLDNTELLLDEIAPHMELRTNMSNEYGIDLRSRSDAQIAEYVIASELTKILGKRPYRPEIVVGTRYNYYVPDYIKFKTEEFQNAVDIINSCLFVVADDGSIQMPEPISKLTISFGGNVYRLGIGGLHSSEETISHIADDEYLLVDRDVASYYPSIVLNQGLYPKHLGKAFLTVYKILVDRRLDAKAKAEYYTKVEPDKVKAKFWKGIADSLKITINGTFGKLGNKWSIIYAPDLLIQVTLTGQLSLLLLIEMIVTSGIQVVSANTDGIIIKVKKTDKEKLDKIIQEWETVTGFNTEEAQYKAVYSRDVNNYIAIKDDGKIKAKGAFSKKGSAGDSPLSRNPEHFVCLDAVTSYITSKIPVRDTIRNCSDVRQFVSVRNVKGGAQKSGQYIGKTIRWYYSTECKGIISYNTSGNKVPKSDGAKPLMELPTELPPDIDFDRYESIAEEMLIDIGAKEKPPIKAANPAFLF